MPFRISTKKAIITLVLIFVAFFVFWQGYKMLKDKKTESEQQKNLIIENKPGSSGEENDKQENQAQTQQQDAASENSYSSDLAPPLNEEKVYETEEDENKETKGDSFINISPTDCTRECEPFKYYEDELEYCRQVCGIIPPEKEADENCDNLEDLEKDYCLKNSAIMQLDSKICGEIEDENIKKSCKNRIVEEILEEN